MPGNFVGQLGDELINRVLDDVAGYAMSKWQALAKDKLHSTLGTYTKGIQPVVKNESGGTSSRTLELTGELALALENGQKAYDMHDTLLGPNVPVVPAGKGLKGKHPKKDGGFYRAIPFRHTNPDSAGLIAPAMGKAYEQNLGVQEAAALGKQIYRQAVQLTQTTGMPGQKITWGGRLAAGLAPKLRPHHAVDIYAGMVKQSKFYEQVSQSSYASFRTISTNSPGWFRKETPGLHLLEQVKTFVESSVIKQAFEDVLEELGG